MAEPIVREIENKMSDPWRIRFETENKWGEMVTRWVVKGEENGNVFWDSSPNEKDGTGLPSRSEANKNCTFCLK